MLKRLAYLTAIGWGLCSCTALKPLSSKTATTSANNTSSGFINTISIHPGQQNAMVKTGTLVSDKKLTPAYSAISTDATTMEALNSLQFKYGILLDVVVEQLTNVKLLEMIDDWYGTKYRYGGTSKQGIDCSGFACKLMGAVFGVNLPRTSKDQYNSSKRINRSELKEGDLVFFDTMGGVSHVGVYLANNKFIHASISGVMITDLKEDYYARRYVGAGRVL